MKERDKVTILNKWLGFSKNENSATEGALKGEIYELYCYDKIIENTIMSEFYMQNVQRIF